MGKSLENLGTDREETYKQPPPPFRFYKPVRD